MLKIHFPTRDKARDYARTSGNPLIDNGKDSLPGKRWAVKAVIVAPANFVPKGANDVLAVVKKPVLNSLKKRVVVIINADKTATDENIENCFSQALAKWKDGKPKESDRINRHTARAELSALFSK